MGTIDIDYGSLGIGLLLMLIPVYFLWHFKTGLLKPVLIGTVRMIIQLFLIGAYLRFLFEWNNPFINFLWLIWWSASQAVPAQKKSGVLFL